MSPISMSEKVDRIAENGLFKLYERALIAVGMPAVLALMGWSSSAVIKLQAEMTEAKTIQETVVVPGLQTLTANAVESARKEFDEDDAKAMEQHLQEQIDQIRKGQNELQLLIVRRLTDDQKLP